MPVAIVDPFNPLDTNSPAFPNIKHRTMTSRRSTIITAIIIVSIFVACKNSDLISTTSTASSYSRPPENAKPPGASLTEIESPKADSTLKETTHPSPFPQGLAYFDQVFSVDKPANYDFPALQQQCERAKWTEDDVYLQCVGMAAGLTSIISQVKVCLKMALEAGTGIVLPSMPLRDSTDLKNFNFLNEDAYMNYEKWFDADHLIDQMGRVCPRMKIVHPDQLDSPLLPVKNRWSIDFASAPEYQQFGGYFWTGRPFKAYFDEQYTRLQQLAFLAPDRDDSRLGITVIKIPSQFLIFRITDDPTGQDLKLWNDLSLLIRFGEAPRLLVNQLLSHITRPFYGVHFRVESDTIWSPLENQLSLDLDALDKAWAKYGTPGAEKPLVYLACGDQQQVEKFVTAGKDRGWEVTHKWQLAQSNAIALEMINNLAFDFQGAVDMGIMIKSHFFLGITGSAFSSTIANVRDITGKYRGSSFTVYDDGGARTHLFNDNDASAYACCL